MTSLIDDDENEDYSKILDMKPLPSNTPSCVTANPHIPSVSASAVLGESETMPEGTPICKGFDFNKTLPQQQSNNNKNNKKNNEDNILDSLMSSMITMGFQSTNIGLAIEQIKQMRSWRLSDVPFREGIDTDEDLKSESIRSKIRARIFLSYTSNQISSGQREIIRFLVEHEMVDVIVTTGGGIEEDVMKCIEPTFMGDFKLDGRKLRKKGVNRIGNLLVPNKNYCKFEDWVAPLITKMHDEQDEKLKEVWKNMMTSSSSNDDGNNDENLDDETRKKHWNCHWTPSEFIRRLGLEINHKESVLYWAAKNDIPVFCPALTDGSIGDMLHFHSYHRPGFILDICRDIRKINDLAVQSHATGMIILGGGIVKHHTVSYEYISFFSF